MADSAVPIDRLAILERDGYVCHLCLDPIPRVAESPVDPLAPTLDHVIPLARGGAHHPDNLAAAHFICNSRKGDRVPDGQLVEEASRGDRLLSLR